MNMEMRLEKLDFSGLSKVKDSLKMQLLNQRKEILDWDQLDEVAAAGNVFQDKKIIDGKWNNQ